MPIVNRSKTLIAMSLLYAEVVVGRRIDVENDAGSSTGAECTVGIVDPKLPQAARPLVGTHQSTASSAGISTGWPPFPRNAA